MFGAVPCRVDLRSRSASLDAAQEAVTAGAAHRHRSVLKRRSCRHRGGDRARRAHDKTCVRDGGELGRGWWAENASRYGRAGPRRAPRRNRALRTNRRNRTPDSPSPNTTRGPPPPVSQSENSDCKIRIAAEYWCRALGIHLHRVRRLRVELRHLRLPLPRRRRLPVLAAVRQWLSPASSATIMAVTASPAMSISADRSRVPKVAKSGGASQSPARRPGGPAARAHLPLNPPLTSL